MEVRGRKTPPNGSGSVPTSDAALEGDETGLEGSMGCLGLWGKELYPERPSAADCSYYMRTGFCGFGIKCRYNHPLYRSSVGRGDYPERVGEPACQFYLKTGTCKFGDSCKFHHPRNEIRSFNLNTYGYPLRPDEKECPYYMKMRQCKFGVACKFHHPQPQSSDLSGSAEEYDGKSPNFMPAKPLPGSYSPMLLPAGVVPFPHWSPYSGLVSPVLPSSASTLAGRHLRLDNGQKEGVFPERPGEAECQYYMKTGDCKFGSSCKFHHPLDWVVSKTNCVLSSLGLPVRPGMQPCSYYLRNGYCKFGCTCKFDHPMGGGTIRYSASSSPSLPEMPVAAFMRGSPIVTLDPFFSFQEQRSDYNPRFNIDHQAGIEMGS